MGAGSLDAVAEPEHPRPVAGVFGLCPGIMSDLRSGWSFCNETMQISARDQLTVCGNLRPADVNG